MKKSAWGILILTALYSFLFYKQNLGVNALLFCVVVLAYFIWENPRLTKSRFWLVVAVCSLFASVFVLIHASSLSILAYCVALLLLSASSAKPHSSYITNLFFGMYSLAGSVIFMLLSVINRFNAQKQAHEKQLGTKYLTYLLPLGISLVFFFIYKNANPLFEKYTRWLNLEFITWGWLFFTFGGLLIVYALVFNQRIEAIDNLEAGQSSDILSETRAEGSLKEKKMLGILFTLLNLMVLLINGLDVNYLYLGAGLPEGVTHKQFVHNGVGTLMLSIMLGIGCILYFFRGTLNFGSENKNLRLLVYAWLLQNFVMVVSTAIRNHMYVTEALLTYKRIGVYYWLFMAAVGLVSVYHKILHKKTAWFMIRNNVMYAFLLLVLSSAVDWDKLITSFNVEKIPNIAGLDKRYLISISETNLATLYTLKYHKDFNTDSSYHYQSRYKTKNTADLDAKLINYLAATTGTDWRSFSFRQLRVSKEIEALNAARKIPSLDLTTSYNLKSKSIGTLSHVKKLKLNTFGTWVETANSLKELDTLCLFYLDSAEVKELTKLKPLKAIGLGHTDSVVIRKVKQKLPGLNVIVLKNNED